jgi:hypothetical protein
VIDHLAPPGAILQRAADQQQAGLAQLPQHVLGALYAYRTCELSTLAKDGTPVTVPTSPVILPEQNRILITTSIGLPSKAFNVRRDGRVSLLFSDPTASGLSQPPAVLIQGDASSPDRVETSTPELDQLWSILAVRQPASNAYGANALTRWFFDWYYMRLLIWIAPRRVRWWERGDFAAAPQELEVHRVG